MKTIFQIIAIAVLITIAVILSQSFHQSFYSPALGPTAFDGKNSSFIIDGKQVTLVNGMATSTVADSGAAIITRYFGNEAVGDLNGDGLEDVAFLVSQETRGSGIFYYIITAINNGNGYKLTNAFFIGDRIAPQSTRIFSSARELHVYFAERNPGESMTTQPSVGAVLVLKVSAEGTLEGLSK